MSRIGIQAAVTMGQIQNKLDVIGHNMANSSTSGYKTRQADFTSLLTQHIDNLSHHSGDAEQRLTPAGIRVGSGAALGHTNINLTSGSIKETGRGLDVALLADNHLFQVNVTENDVTETRYTRDGSFYLSPVNNNEVMLTNKAGHPVIGENGPLVFADGFEDIAIKGNGVIEVTRNGVSGQEGQLALVEAARPRLLEATGANNFRLPNLNEMNVNINEVVTPVNEQDIQMKSSALESSNVDMAAQMSELLMTQRAYQFNARSISMDDKMAGLVNELR